MATIQRFEDLQVWMVSRELYCETGKLIDTGTFGKNFRFIAQVESSCGSIMYNIAEGFERGTRPEFIQFPGYSKGSCGELRSQLYRLLDRSFISKGLFDKYHSFATRISMMLQKLIAYLRKTKMPGARAC
ncbi:MAG: four helix bundle protein [Ferruginibacter sp.]